jgi:hypothetical protein
VVGRGNRRSDRRRRLTWLVLRGLRPVGGSIEGGRFEAAVGSTEAEVVVGSIDELEVAGVGHRW